VPNDSTGRQRPNAVRAWQPPVPGVHEVFHARFADHAYPLHTHDAWTLLIIDDGAVTYDLDHREHGALQSTVSLLPPHVAHDGRPADTGGFRKRVVYLDPETIGTGLIGRAVDQPDLVDPLLRHRVDRLHAVLARPGENLEAESRLSMITERLRWHLQRRPPARQPDDRRLAARLRELLDEHLVDGLELGSAADRLGASPTHLIRSFTRTYGLPPHRYLTGRRVERARRLLLAGSPITDAAQAAGFYDQAHLSRHLRRMIGASPGEYRRSAL
jgi:AraC-like DNA-binding protein